MNTIFVADVVENNGLTIRENNMKTEHKIPLGSLVEVNIPYIEEHGVRLFVVSHERDCDGTPLYTLSFDKEAGDNLKSLKQELEMLSPGSEDYNITRYCYNRAVGSVTGGFSEDSLIVIK